MRTLIPHLIEKDFNGAADALLRRAIEIWSKMNFARDDITFILVKLNEIDSE